jgi:UDP-N-acetylglucosamine transferase subunit ALG13
MQSKGGDESIAVDYFTFSSSIADHLRAASLVISHAGIVLIVSSTFLPFVTT